MDDLISRAAVVGAIKAYWKKVVDDIPKDAGFEEVTRLCDLALQHNAGILNAIEELPSAQPEIIRCRDCIHTHDHDCPVNWGRTEDDYCSWAER